MRIYQPNEKIATRKRQIANIAKDAGIYVGEDSIKFHRNGSVGISEMHSLSDPHARYGTTVALFTALSTAFHTNGWKLKLMDAARGDTYTFRIVHRDFAEEARQEEKEKADKANFLELIADTAALYGESNYGPFNCITWITVEELYAHFRSLILTPYVAVYGGGAYEICAMYREKSFKTGMYCVVLSKNGIPCDIVEVFAKERIELQYDETLINNCRTTFFRFTNQHIFTAYFTSVDDDYNIKLPPSTTKWVTLNVEIDELTLCKKVDFSYLFASLADVNSATKLCTKLFDAIERANEFLLADFSIKYHRHSFANMQMFN